MFHFKWQWKGGIVGIVTKIKIVGVAVQQHFGVLHAVILMSLLNYRDWACDSLSMTHVV